MAQIITPNTDIPTARASFKKGAAVVINSTKDNMIIQNDEGHVKGVTISTMGDKGALSADPNILEVADQVLDNWRKTTSEERIQEMLGSKGSGTIIFESPIDEEKILLDLDNTEIPIDIEPELDENAIKILQSFQNKPKDKKLIRTTTPGISITCVSCNFTNIPTTAKYCPECGNALMSKFCMNCGFKFINKEKFCPECGTNR